MVTRMRISMSNKEMNHFVVDKCIGKQVEVSLSEKRNQCGNLKCCFSVMDCILKLLRC